MKSFKEIAEQTGTDIELVRDMMKYAHKTYYGVWDVFHVAEDGTRITGSGATRDEAVIHALEHNAQN